MFACLSVTVCLSVLSDTLCARFRLMGLFPLCTYDVLQVLFDKLCLHEQCENRKLPRTLNKQQQSTSEAAVRHLQTHWGVSLDPLSCFISASFQCLHALQNTHLRFWLPRSSVELCRSLIPGMHAVHGMKWLQCMKCRHTLKLTILGTVEKMNTEICSCGICSCLSTQLLQLQHLHPLPKIVLEYRQVRHCTLAAMDLCLWNLRAKPMSKAVVLALESPGSQTQVHLCWWDSLVHDEQGENAAALKAPPTLPLHFSAEISSFVCERNGPEWFFFLGCMWNNQREPVSAGYSPSPWRLLSRSGSEKMHTNCFSTRTGPFSALGWILLTNLCSHSHANEVACASGYLLTVFCFVSGGGFYCCVFFRLRKRLSCFGSNA